MRARVGFYHPRTIDHDPTIHGIHIRRCKVCGRRYEDLAMPDPSDPYDGICGECLLNGRVRP